MGTTYNKSSIPKKNGRVIVIPTFDEMLSELDERNKIDGWSVAEMSAKIGVGKEACRKRVAKLIESGTVECVGKKRAYRIDGDGCLVPAYRYVGKQ